MKTFDKYAIKKQKDNLKRRRVTSVALREYQYIALNLAGIDGKISEMFRDFLDEYLERFHPRKLEDAKKQVEKNVKYLGGN